MSGISQIWDPIVVHPPLAEKVHANAAIADYGHDAWEKHLVSRDDRYGMQPIIEPKCL